MGIPGKAGLRGIMADPYVQCLTNYISLTRRAAERTQFSALARKPILTSRPIEFTPNKVRFPTDFAEGVMPDGGARSATLERMSPLSLMQAVRGAVPCADHFGLMPVMDTYRLAV